MLGLGEEGGERPLITASDLDTLILVSIIISMRWKPKLSPKYGPAALLFVIMLSILLTPWSSSSLLCITSIAALLRCSIESFDVFSVCVVGTNFKLCFWALI
jgi:hypothetical protein